jgi:MutS domain V
MSAPPPDPAATTVPALEVHSRLHALCTAEAQRHERTANRYSLLRLLTFVGSAAFFTAGAMGKSVVELAVGAVLLVAFGIAVVLHARTLQAQTRARVRGEVHQRHLQRLRFAFQAFPNQGTGLLAGAHAYAFDIDLVGRASLFQRIDVTHTLHGGRTLAAWLGEAASREAITQRQAAVRELSDLIELREALEAAAGEDPQRTLDPSGLQALLQRPSLFERSAWLRVVALALPAITLGTYVAGQLGLIPGVVWLLPVVAQVGLLMRMGEEVRAALDLVTAKAGVFTAFEQMLLVLERAKLQSPLLQSLQQRIALGDIPASSHLQRIARWAGFAELRQNGLFYVFVNTLTLWDLHVLWGVERFVRDVGQRIDDWFVALGELEALCSLATLAAGDPDATFPEIVADGGALRADGLGHPLLAPSVRVRNDVALRGPGTALVVTGSNMAGKSTLLRAVGQNIALGLAGGPVIAHKMQLPLLRLRASMRADDSLAAGSSYFHAELQKLKGVVTGAEDAPPVFFLLDELLRGTNARARHVGAKAVLLHLLDRSATGLCATHDVELAALEREQAERIANVHFTDVMVEGEMRFDYRLRPGIVRTSNALRLLRMAGIDVPEAEREAMESAGSGETPAAATRTGTPITGLGTKEAR